MKNLFKIFIIIFSFLILQGAGGINFSYNQPVSNNYIYRNCENIILKTENNAGENIYSNSAKSDSQYISGKDCGQNNNNTISLSPVISADLCLDKTFETSTFSNREISIRAP